MMSKNKKDPNTLIKELEAKIAILEGENASLSDEAESTLLLSLVSESLERYSNDIHTLLENALERIAVLKNLPFCCCASWEENRAGIINSYLKSGDERNANIEITIDKKIANELEAGSGIFDLKKSKKIKLKLGNDKNEFAPLHLLLIPFKTKSVPNGLFIFADDNGSDRLTGMTFVLQHMVNMICEKMDKLMLQSDLVELNRTLEGRVEERTRELIEANEKLKIEIAEKTKTEEALFESETKFRSIAEQLSDILFLTDEKGIITYISASAEKIFKWTPQEMTGKIFTSFLFESEIPKAFEAFSAAVNKKIDTRDLVLLMKRKDGSSFYGELDATVWKLESGFGTLGVIRDISERKHSEDEVRLANLELTTLNRIISESVHQLDSKKLLETALDEALKISGLEAGTVCMVAPNKSLRLVVERNISEATRSDLNTSQIMIGECLCGNSALDQKPLILNNREEVLKYSSRESQRQEPINFHAAFPIVAKERSIGVLCVFTRTEKKPTARSLKLIEAVTDQISLSLENANLYERLQRNLADLEEEISERREAEEALRNSEYFFKESQRAAFIGSYNCDFVKGVWESSEVLDQIFGIDKNFRRDVPSWFKIVHPDDREMMDRYLTEEVIGAHKTFDKEYRIIRQTDGEVRWVYGRGTVGLGSDGNVVSMIGTIQDTTERVRGEETLAKFKKALDASGEAIFLTDIHGIFTYINPAFTSLYGFTADEVIGKATPRILKSGILDQSVYVQFWETLKNQDEIRGEIVNRRKDGKLIDVGGSASSIVDDENNLIGYLGIQHDITEQKQIEQALIKSESEYRNLFNNASDAILIFEPDSEVILEVNRRACELYGFSREEFISMNLKRITKDVEKGEKQIQKTLSEGSYKNFESQHFTKDGRLLDLSINASVIEYQGKKAIFSINHDITERKIAEAAVRESENLFRQMNINSPLGMHFYELNGNNELIFTGANPAADRLLGLDNSQFIGRTIEDSFPGLAGTEVAERYRDAAAKGILWATEQIFYKDGHIDGAFEVKAFQTTPGKMVAVFMEISARKKAEEALKESEEKFRTIFDQSPIGIELYDAEGMQIAANLASLEMFGIQNVVNMKKFNIFSGTSLTEEIKQKLKRGESVSYQSSFDFEEVKRLNQYPTCKSGKAYLDYLITPISGTGYKSSLGYLLQVQDITERKKIEADLRESEEIFNQFLKHSPVYLFFKDDQIRSLRLSDNYEKMLGRPLDELIGKNMYDLFPSDLAQKIVEDDMRILKNGVEVNTDEEFNGRHYTTIKFPIHVEGKPAFLAGFTIDITERKKAEAEINMLANALRSVDECVTITDMDDTLLFANQSFLKTYGYTQEELIGKRMSLLRSENNPAEITDTILPSTLAGGWSGELINVRKDGTEFPIYLSTSVINDKEGKPVGLIGIAQDITERKRSEQEIISQRNKLEQLIINSPVAIAHIDEDDKIVDVNSSFSTLFGYSHDETLGLDLNDFILPDEERAEGERLSEETHRGKSAGAEGYRKRKDGSQVFVQIVGIPIQLNNRITGTYVMYLDLSHRMIAEQEAIRSKEVAEQSDKMKSEFLAQMSHEIRTPINIIVSNISFIKDQMEEKLDSDDEECFESINLATQRIIRTIELILNMSELQTGAYKSVYRKLDLDSQILQYLYNEFLRSAKMKGIELLYRNEIGEGEIDADEYSVLQIFANLVDNAIKYTKEGRVEIVLGIHHTNEIMVEVKDTGIGIGNDFLPHLFEPFSQEEQGYTRTYEGNGLGLSLVKRYCEINKASIEVESNKNSGSTFRVIFPNNLKAIQFK